MVSALTLLQISRDPTPCMAEVALAMVNIEVGLHHWLPCYTPHVVIRNYNMWGVTWQSIVVQPHLDVHHRQGRLGRHGVGHPHQELQHVPAEGCLSLPAKNHKKPQRTINVYGSL